MNKTVLFIFLILVSILSISCRIKKKEEIKRIEYKGYIIIIYQKKYLTRNLTNVIEIRKRVLNKKGKIIKDEFLLISFYDTEIERLYNYIDNLIKLEN